MEKIDELEMTLLEESQTLLPENIAQSRTNLSNKVEKEG